MRSTRAFLRPCTVALKTIKHSGKIPVPKVFLVEWRSPWRLALLTCPKAAGGALGSPGCRCTVLAFFLLAVWLGASYLTPVCLGLLFHGMDPSTRDVMSQSVQSIADPHYLRIQILRKVFFLYLYTYATLFIHVNICNPKIKRVQNTWQALSLLRLGWQLSCQEK